MEDRVHHLQPALGEGSRQRLVRAPLRGHVADRRHAAPPAAVGVEQRPASGPDDRPFRHETVPDQDVPILGEPAENRPHDRQLSRRQRRVPFRIEATVRDARLVAVPHHDPLQVVHPDPFARFQIDYRGGGRIDVDQVALRVGNEDAVRNRLERGLHQLGLVAQIVQRAPQRSLRFLPGSEVGEHDDAALNAAVRGPERPGAGIDGHALRPPRVANHHFRVVQRLTAHRAHQRHLVGRSGRRAVRQEDAVVLRPLFGRHLDDVPADDVLGGRVEGDEVAVDVGRDDAGAQAVEDRVHQVRLALKTRDRVFELRAHPLLFRQVADHEDAGPPLLLRPDQRLGADADEAALGPAGVANEESLALRRAAPDGAPERTLILRKRRLPVGQEDAERLPPLAGPVAPTRTGPGPAEGPPAVPAPRNGAAEPLGGAVPHQQFAAFVGDDEAFPHALEDRLHQAGPRLLFGDRGLQLLARTPLGGHVPNQDDRSRLAAPAQRQRLGADADESGHLGSLRVAHAQEKIVDLLAPERPGERKIVPFQGLVRFDVAQAPVQRLHQTASRFELREKRRGARAGRQPDAVLVGGEQGVRHEFEDRVEDGQPALQATNLPLQLFPPPAALRPPATGSQGGAKAELQLPVRKRPQQIAEGASRRGRLEQLLRCIVHQEHDRRAETLPEFPRGPDPFRRRFGTQIEQDRAGTIARGPGEQFGAVRRRGHGMTQRLQARFKHQRFRRAVPDDHHPVRRFGSGRLGGRRLAVGAGSPALHFTAGVDAAHGAHSIRPRSGVTGPATTAPP